MKLVVTPPALAELHDAAAFYTLKAGVELGLALVAEFERTANLVLDNPLLGAVFRSKRRQYILRRFPYSIIYQITAFVHKAARGRSPNTLVRRKRDRDAWKRP
ncbi:type II toxin-antitoxin system RelE/ParE family toxin [Acidithiobacillus ferrianus]|uniref:type II toxin-antitoxin system RelE/ParE family toxin n=1 Tax=Acidithiobacillus ferrianus TaxID=2678518 RepID=UPI0034E3F994